MGPLDSDSKGQVERRNAIYNERMGIWAWNNSIFPKSDRKYKIFADVPVDVWWEDRWCAKEGCYVEWIGIELMNHPHYLVTRYFDPDTDIVFSWCPNILDLAEGRPVIFMAHRATFGKRLDQKLTYIFGFKETEKNKKKGRTISGFMKGVE